MEKFIIIKDKLKIRNPCYNQSNIYDGHIDGFLFTDKDRNINQDKNYTRLKDIFSEYNINLSHVWSGTTNDLTKFLVKSDQGEVFWYKYEGKVKGGSQNNLFIFGKKIKLTDWFSLTSNERDEYIL